jgi:polysaccharide biosynthesis transport protein
MPLQEKRNNSDALEALEEINLLPVKTPQSVYPHFAQPQNSILHYWQILRKRKWAVLATFVIVFALSVIRTLKETPLYQATSKIAIFPENPNVLGFKDVDNNLPDFDYEATLETQVAILRSDALALKVIKGMHLDQDPTFTRATRPQAEDPMQPDPAREAGLLGAFRGGLGVQMIPNTRLVQVSYTHSNPRLAEAIVNKLVETFREENTNAKYESVNETSEWLKTKLDDLRLKVQTSEEKLVRYQKDHSILGVDEKQNIVTAKLNELNNELTVAQTDRIQKESNYNLAVAGDPATFVKTSRDGPNSMLDKLREKEADLNTQYAQATTQFGSGYPKVVELNNQLKQVRAEIVAEEARMQQGVRDEYLAAVQRENLLTTAFNRQTQLANELNESAIEYSVLKRDAEANRQLYQDLLQRFSEASVSETLKSSNIRVVDRARTPTSPITPNVPRNIELGLLFGLACGIGLAFVLESLDTSIRNTEQLSAVSTLPALGTIPLQRKRLKKISAESEKSELPALVTHARPKSEAAEAFRALRTSILLSSFGAAPKVILVTSASPQEGKTTVSANSALVLAQRGSRVLLVDADLRRPGIGKLFGFPSDGRGLSSLISGVHKIEDVVVPSQVPNLWILPAGRIPPDPVELLGSHVMKGYIARWRKEFDHIIIDTPPCLSVTDAVVLSPEVDRVILVARSGKTTTPALRRACDLLLQVNARVMGIVLNAFGSGDSYHYTNDGRYSYYYDEASPQDETTAANKAS